MLQINNAHVKHIKLAYFFHSKITDISVVTSVQLSVFCEFSGIFYALRRRDNATIEGYLMGNRKLSWIPVCLSLVVSFESAILMLGYPAGIHTKSMHLFN